ncbi:MAG: 3'-5' exonuclease [Burkholderiales bacterium]|nr:3'-5' exonuclease [Burkholderiales bacterium]
MAIFLDTETTGLSPSRGAAIVELAIVDAAGNVLIDSLIDPGKPIPAEASRIHGITDAMVRGKPSLADVMPQVVEIISKELVVIYNAGFDSPFFPGRLRQSQGVRCAMTEFADALGGPWRKLDVAARHVGHKWTGAAHRALSDAQACRSVWLWLEARRQRAGAGR